MFDKVFKPNASQEKVYNEAAKSIVKGISISSINTHLRNILNLKHTFFLIRCPNGL
jgi:hypothetical protein